MGRIEAAWVEPAATALRAVEMAGDLAGRTVLVTGSGPIGQLACRIAWRGEQGRASSSSPPTSRRFAGASQAGLVLTAAEAARLAGDLRIDVAVECSGSAAAAGLAVDALLPGGVLVAVGAGTGPGLEPTALLLKDLTVRGSFTCTGEFDRAINMLASGAIQVADLTTAVVSLNDALEAFESLRAAQTMKVLIAPNG